MSKTITKQLCEAIGEIGSSVLNEDKLAQEWQELPQQIFTLFQKDTREQYQGFIILFELVTYCSQIFDKYAHELKILFQNSLNHQDSNIKVASNKCFCQYITTTSNSIQKQCSILITTQLQGAYSLFNEKDNDEAQEVLEEMQELAEGTPKFYRQNYDYIFQFVHKVFNQVHDWEEKHEIRINCIEIVLSLIEGSKDLKTGDTLSQLIEMIFTIMINIEDNISEEWKAPPEGYNEDFDKDSDFEVARTGMKYIDSLIESVVDENKGIWTILNNIVTKMLQMKNWKYTNAIIIALSQVGEYMKFEEIHPIFNIILQFVKHENPLIRYSCYHAIGQLSDDLKETEIFARYHQQIMPICVEGIADETPRVVSHCCAALSNFIESADKDQIAPYLQSILISMVKLLNEGISIVKEGSLGVISSLAEAANNYFDQYVDQLVPLLLQKLELYENDKIYKSLKGKIIETVTIIAQNVTPQKFTMIQNLLNIMIRLTNSNFDEVDASKSYVISGWQRLILNFAEQIKQNINNIVPQTIKLIEQIINECTIGKENTYDAEEATLSIELLGIFLDELGEAYIPYLEQTVNLIKTKCLKCNNLQIKEKSVELLPDVIKASKVNEEANHQLIKHFISLIMEQIDNEFDTENIIDFINSMKECLNQSSNFLSQQEITNFYQKILKLLQASEARSKENRELAEEEESVEEKEMYMADNDSEEDLNLAIAEIFGVLFKTHPTQSLQFANQIYTSILPQVVKANSLKLNKFAVYVASDMIEFLGYESIKDKWVHLIEVLVRFSNNTNPDIRQACGYGIGITAIKSPQEVFASQSVQLLNILNNITQFQLTAAQNKDKFKHARDNGVAGLAKVIKHQGNNIPNLQEAVQNMINSLPLKKDLEESKICNQLLADILLQSQNLVFDQNFSQMKKILQIIGTVYDSKMTNKETDIKLLEVLKNLKNNQMALNTIEACFPTLTKKIQDNLKKMTV